MITRPGNGVGRLADGYHGTTAQQAEQILTDGFELNRNSHHWLGHGVYFFQDAPRLAFCWASTRWSQSEVCVLRATIDLSHCLDLFDYKGKRQYEAEYRRFFDIAGRDFFEHVGQSSVGHRYVDCLIFNLLCTRLAEEGHLVTVVRCPFDDGPPVWEDAQGELVAAGPSINGHVQLAVRELSAISKLEVIEDVNA